MVEAMPSTRVLLSISKEVRKSYSPGIVEIVATWAYCISFAAIVLLAFFVAIEIGIGDVAISWALAISVLVMIAGALAYLLNQIVLVVKVLREGAGGLAVSIDSALEVDEAHIASLEQYGAVSLRERSKWLHYYVKRLTRRVTIGAAVVSVGNLLLHSKQFEAISQLATYVPQFRSFFDYASLGLLIGALLTYIYMQRFERLATLMEMACERIKDRV